MFRKRFKREEEKYNGWTNRETWALALWIDNEEYIYEEVYEIVSNAKKYGASDYMIADKVKEYIDEYYDEFWENLNKYHKNMWQDIGSYWRVNWVELIEYYDK